ncbi:unnamed protein product [Bubo scandiacus]
MCEKRIIWQREPRRRGLTGGSLGGAEKGGGQARGKRNRRPGNGHRRRSNARGPAGRCRGVILAAVAFSHSAWSGSHLEPMNFTDRYNQVEPKLFTVRADRFLLLLTVGKQKR